MPGTSRQGRHVHVKRGGGDESSVKAVRMALKRSQTLIPRRGEPDPIRDLLRLMGQRARLERLIAERRLA